MAEHVEIARRGASLEIQFDRVDKKNAITGAMYAAMAEAIFAAENDPEVVSIVFAGRGAGFCSGNDLADFLSSPMNANSPVLSFLKAKTNLFLN